MYKKAMLLIFLFLLVACSAKPDFYDKALTGYMDDIKTISLANDWFNAKKKEGRVEKDFYDMLLHMKIIINPSNNRCDKECFLKLAKLEATMLLVQNMASNYNIPFTSKPFYKWKEKVINGEDIPLNFFDNITPAP